MPHGVLFECFWAPGSECPKECFWAFSSPKKAKKHSKSTLWGTPSQVPKNTQKALRGALSGPGPKSTPVNGGRDRKTRHFSGGLDSHALGEGRYRSLAASLVAVLHCFFCWDDWGFLVCRGELQHLWKLRVNVLKESGGCW